MGTRGRYILAGAILAIAGFVLAGLTTTGTFDRLQYIYLFDLFRTIVLAGITILGIVLFVSGLLMSREG
jgi:hypothetical protein